MPKLRCKIGCIKDSQGKTMRELFAGKGIILVDFLDGNGPEETSFDLNEKGLNKLLERFRESNGIRCDLQLFQTASRFGLS